MTITRAGLGFTIECDKSRCSHSDDSDSDDFGDAKDEFKDGGWKTYKDKDGDWCNTCPSCAEEQQRGDDIEDLK